MGNKKAYKFKVVADLGLEELNQFGNQGFRLVTVNKNTKDNNSLLYYLEREIDNIADVKDKTANETIKSAFDYPNFVETYKRSIWHTSHEEPQNGLNVRCLVEFNYDEYHDTRTFEICSYHQTYGFGTSIGWLKLYRVVRWAYMHDITLEDEE